MAKAASLRIAIIGGGIAGVSLANGLLKHQHLDFHVYESSTTFKERGASVGCSINARNALNALGLTDVLKAAKGITIKSSRIYMGVGPNAGDYVVDVGAGDGSTITVHRAELLTELLRPIPTDRLHVSKKVTAIQDSKTVYFEDGTHETFDAIIGADGIHSFMRGEVLGTDHPAYKPIFSGFWDCRNVIPANLAIEKIGSKYINFKEPRQNLWMGQDSIQFTDLISDGELVCVVVAGSLDKVNWNSSDEWRKPVSQDWLTSRYTEFGDFGKAMLELLLHEQKDPFIFLEYESANAPTIVRKNIALMGDAAGAPTPWQGSGAAMSFEDAALLEKLLGHCFSVQDVEAAFSAYDQVRLPRRTKIAASSSKAGRVVLGQSEWGFDTTRIRNNFPQMWNYIFGYSPEDEHKEAISIINKMKQSPN